MRLQHTIIHLLPLEILFLGGAIIGWAFVRAGHLEIAAPLPAAAAPAEAAAPAGLAAVFTPEVQHWAADIQAWAETFGLEPNLVATVMQIESCGWAGAVSGSGAQGLFQVMPFHFDPGEDMQAPDTNAARGLAYLALGLQRAQGDVTRALAGYNGGLSQIDRAPAAWPEQTQRYAYWGAGIYAEARQGAAPSPRLQEWLSHGGASLCRRAAAALGLTQ